MKTIKQCITGLALAGFSFAAQAIDWTREDYAFYVGDYGSNGSLDVMVVPEPRIIIIHRSGVRIPVDLRTESYLVTPGSSSTIFDVNRNTLNSSWTRDRYQAVYGDFNGDGTRDAILQSDSNGDALLILGGAENTIAINQQMGLSNYGIDLTRGQVTLTAEDVNGDGRDDLVITQVDGAQTVSYGSASGLAVYDNRWTGADSLAAIEVQGDADQVLVNQNAMSFNVWQCPRQAPARLSVANPVFKTNFLQISTAYMTGMPIDLRIQGCSRDGYPNITDIRMTR